MSGKKSKAKPMPAPAAPPGKKAPSKRIVKSGNAGNSSDSVQPEKKPSIFGDWTGKTPVSLLHEHCQKHGWEKPTFDIARRKQGYVGTVQLSKRNKKTAQMETVSLNATDLYLPTSIEAKHLAATYALHRVNSHMPMYRVLPPQHRDYWQQFEQQKTNANAWQYAPDPFSAQPPKPQLRAKTDRLPNKEHPHAAVPMPMRSDNPELLAQGKKRQHEVDEKMQKHWQSLPAVHMAADHRMLVEKVVKESNVVYQPLYKQLPSDIYSDICQGLVRMGFRESHVREALEYCSDMAGALDWLCLHVPEDDLPTSFMHANYNPTMTTISHTTQSLGRDWLIKRMTTIGYPATVCEEAMKANDDDDSKALEWLQWRLVHGDEPMLVMDDSCAEENQLVREEETLTLESIYETRFQHEVDTDQRLHYKLQFTAQTSANARRQPLLLEVIIPAYSTYPHMLPIFVVECDGLPSYLKLSIIKGLVEEAEKNLGLPLVYMCAEWLQEHVDVMIANPPKLRDITERIAAVESAPSRKNKTAKRSKHTARPSKSKPNDDVSQKLKTALEDLHASAEYATLGKVRAALPANRFQTKVVQAVLANQVTIVSGETGCGKTTQVPQFILDEEIKQKRGSMCNIICTQPRKISAIGVADRVAAERCEKTGQTVGYAVRGETKVSSQTQLQFCTTGVLLRRLHSDPMLGGISHVLIDEVHERSVDSDFLLIILREVLKKRKDLKVVLMSATINQQLFADYFNGAPAIEIPGFTHPVEDFYLEDVLSMTSYVSKLPMPKRDKEDKGEWAEWQLGYLEQGYDANTVRSLERYRNQDKIDYDMVAHTVKYIIEHEVVKLDNGAEPAILIFMPGKQW
ncbi:hypothetical protein DFQ28_004675 [Apophysomyces sp. BC1034]|nr:hypothetical protein DFQ30_005626 [Apophysomyces sp. BC1015]KAG0183090.1 hypothetical protein DFQ29_000093 [Apophysomyces sp. BC1021]KAG0193555.1 hypothetical protein DFQ28_004675 [Apophysomyces sp. BC1034]